MTNIEKLKILTGESDESLLSLLYEEAMEYVLSYTNRTRIIPELEKTVRDLVVVSLNRMGTEGESSRSEGGSSYSFESMSPHIYNILNRYRLARCGGHAFEKKEFKEVLPEKQDN